MNTVMTFCTTNVSMAIVEKDYYGTLFLKELSNYDSLLLSTTDKTVISSLISQVLSKYEEVVISGKN